MLIISWPWALLGSKFLINVAVSSQLKVIAEADLSVFLRKLKESSLDLSIIENCLAILKFVTYLLFKSKGGIQGIFLFSNVFNIDQ